MKIDDEFIGTVLYYGIWVATLLMVLGGVVFLIQEGQQPYISLAANKTINHLQLDARSIIQWGLWLVLGVQLLRVFATSIMFLLKKEVLMFFISILVFCLLVATFF